MTNKNEINKGFEETIKSKIDGFEFPYEPADWAVMEQKLDAIPKGFLGTIGRKIAAASVFVAVIVASILYFGSDRITDTTISAKSEAAAISQSDITPAVSTPLSTEVVEHTHPVKAAMKPANTTPPIENTTNTKLETVPKLQETTNTASNKNLVSDNNQSIRKKETILPLKKDQPDANIVYPDASFNVDQLVGCQPLRVEFTPNEESDSIFYLWNFGNGVVSTQANPVITFNNPGEYNVSLTVSYFKSDLESVYSLPQAIEVIEGPDASFKYIIEEQNYVFTVDNIGYKKYSWLLVDLTFENQSMIEYRFIKNGVYPVSCIAENEYGCIDTAKQVLEVIVEHPIFMANAFTPDGDGDNDYFGPRVDELIDMEYNFQIYSREGSVVFETGDIGHKWDGTINTGNMAKQGVYVWKIITTDKYGNSCKKMGNVTLIRKY